MKRSIAILAAPVLCLATASPAVAKPNTVTIQGYALGFFEGSIDQVHLHRLQAEPPG